MYLGVTQTGGSAVRIFFFILLAVFASPAWAQNELEPVRAMLLSDSISQPQQLNGKSTEITVNGVGVEQTVSLSPEGAFTVEKMTNMRYRVTIVKGDLLSYNDDGIWRWRKIGLQVVAQSDLLKGTAIRGAATCDYRVRYSQVGAGELSLDQLQSNFAVSWTINGNSGSAQVAIGGKDLIVTRGSGENTPFGIILKLDHKTDKSKSLVADAVVIPSCSSAAPTTTTTTVYKEADISPGDCFQTETRVDIACPDCGPRSATLNFATHNICSRTVQCSVRMAFGASNQVLKQAPDSIYVAPKSTYNWTWTFSYGSEIKNFWVSGPSYSGCYYKT